MCMKISTKGRYALRLMLDVALHSHGAAVPLRDVAQRQEISDKYLEQIVTQLSGARGAATSSPVSQRSTPWGRFCGCWRAIWRR